MNIDNLRLWHALRDFELDDDNAQLTFSDRLAKENGWTHEFSQRVIIEYKRFIFLIVASNQPLTPSDEVDQVWHLHLLYTQSYWKEMCGQILKREIHHGPTKGGQSEASKFSDWYLRTIKLYQFYFKETPPKDIWPPKERRFTNVNFQRVNIDRHWVIKKPFN